MSECAPCCYLAQQDPKCAGWAGGEASGCLQSPGGEDLLFPIARESTSPKGLVKRLGVLHAISIQEGIDDRASESLGNADMQMLMADMNTQRRREYA